MTQDWVSVVTSFGVVVGLVPLLILILWPNSNRTGSRNHPSARRGFGAETRNSYGSRIDAGDSDYSYSGGDWGGDCSGGDGGGDCGD